MLYKFYCTVIMFMLIISGTSAGAVSSEMNLYGPNLEKDARLINLRVDRTNCEIMLDDTELIEDDGPATGVPEGYDYRGNEWKEDLKKGVVIKKILVTGEPRAWSGRLVFKAIEVKNNTAPLHISVNGVKYLRPASLDAAPLAVQFSSGWDRWYYVDMPVGALKKGENEILMWAESDSTSWRILIALEEEFARGSVDRSHHPNRSMKSSDGGRTWSDTKLGAVDSVDGEYSIRISLDHHVSTGEYISPVIDIVDDSCLLKRNVFVNRIEYLADFDIPEETSAEVMIRFGTSPREDISSWTDWGTVAAGKVLTVTENIRYIQWKSSLSTANPTKSPRIKGFKIRTDWEDRSPNGEFGLTVDVVHNGRVARSSFPFGYENLLHPGLKKLRKDYKLDRIVKDARTEFDVMMRLLNWAYRIPVTSDQYSWDWNDVPLLVKGESGMPKLQPDYEGRRRDAMCLYSNQALIGALLSFGFQARHSNIHSEGVSGHEITEVWSNDFNKWVHMDATRDYYYFDLDTGIPLNVLEIHNLLAEQVPRVETWQRPFAPELADRIGPRIRIGMREGDNPVSIVEHGRHLLEIMGHFRIIPRNDFLTRPLPVPVHTGATMWGWDGFLNYYDAKFPKRYEYQLQTDRALDFYEPLNQAEVFLHETDEPGVLEVEVDTFTPGGFDAFLIRIDDGEWTEQKEQGWIWPLTGGIHMLEVRTRNVCGVLGPTSKMKVTYNP
ncbi:MAG: hypothetical protein HOC71_01525 [Candidatus Latescibacteria bacterium]|jgi:hypothetical protein|nr:hypothetical protein [Candidatus Latescibacterota bacterium]